MNKFKFLCWIPIVGIFYIDRAELKKYSNIICKLYQYAIYFAIGYELGEIF